MGAIPPTLDHLIYATPDLRGSVADLETRLGVEFLIGGAHPAWGTRNALLPLSTTSYLEVIGPDPELQGVPAPTLFGIANLSRGRLLTWAAKATTLHEVTARARLSGLDLGEVIEGSRLRPDGTRLSWQLTDPFAPRSAGVVPFFIHWSEVGHPATLSSPRAELLSLTAYHPTAAEVRAQLAMLDVGLEVEVGLEPAFTATLRTPKGLVELS